MVSLWRLPVLSSRGRTVLRRAFIMQRSSPGAAGMVIALSLQSVRRLLPSRVSNEGMLRL